MGEAEEAAGDLCPLILFVHDLLFTSVARVFFLMPFRTIAILLGESLLEDGAHLSSSNLREMS